MRCGVRLDTRLFLKIDSAPKNHDPTLVFVSYTSTD